MAASPVPFKVGESEVDLHPLNFTEWGTIETWMRREVLSAINSMVGDDTISDKNKKLLIREATREAAAINLRSVDARQGLLDSFAGTMRVVFTSVKKGDPKMTLEKLEKLFSGNISLLSDAGRTVFEHSFPEITVPEGQPGNPTETTANETTQQSSLEGSATKPDGVQQ